ncbi:MAG: DUF115 domain-containing protein [Thermoplasmata archaeon]|nr:DUF115 domain-containing protein [Thermoplasmata archaeon]
MQWNEWKPWYERITADLGINPARDMESAKLLAVFLASRSSGTDELEALIRGKDAIVFGPAPFTNHDFGDSVKISAGSSAESLAGKGIIPDILVTDLDGDVSAQAEANRKGAFAVIHAHGDNMNEVREWVPKFIAPVIGTTQAKPIKGIHNFGGFTDGDRAVFLAIHFGAQRIHLVGFDFVNPSVKPGGNPSLKKVKMGYARQLIEFASRTYGTEILPETD